MQSVSPASTMEITLRMARASLAYAASSSAVLPNMAQSINITELNLPQLEMLKNQLDQVRTCPSTFLPLHVLRPRALRVEEASFPRETPIRSPVPPPLPEPRFLGSPADLFFPPGFCRKWSFCPRPLLSSRWYRLSMWKPRTV